MRQTDHTAILLFSRTPQEEARSKKIVSRRKTIAVAHVLQQQSSQEARLTGLPVFRYTSVQQHGHSFGERLANAIETTFAKGYERLLIIGNDTPDLDKNALENARQLLANDQLVLGPSLDGGVYLIGIHAANYQRALFIQLAWETAQLQDTFTAYAQQCALKITHLAPLSDIDNTLDFWSFFHQLLPDNKLLVLFKALFESSARAFLGHYTPPLKLVIYPGCQSLRAPPF